MPKAEKAPTTTTKARKPTAKGKRGKREKAALVAGTAAVKRSAPKASWSAPFRLTRADRELQAELRRLYDDAYKHENSPDENASRKVWKAYHERCAVAREAFQAAVNKALAKHQNPRTLRARRYRSPDQLAALAVIGGFSVEADRYLGEMIRNAAGLRR